MYRGRYRATYWWHMGRDSLCCAQIWNFFKLECYSSSWDQRCSNHRRDGRRIFNFCMDLITMNTFMGRYGNWNEWQDVSKHSVGTQGFFKEVMNELNERRYGMVTITEKYGWPSLKEMYKKGRHGALTVAFVLAHLCCRKKSLLRHQSLQPPRKAKKWTQTHPQTHPQDHPQNLPHEHRR